MIVLCWIVLTTCSKDGYINDVVKKDLTEIKKKGKLVALTSYNATDYFVFNGHPMGFQFELLKSYAEYSGLELEIIVSNDLSDYTSKLLEGKCDIVAVNIPITSEMNRYLAFTDPLMQSRQVLVQRKPDNWQQLSPDALNKKLIKSPLDLDGKTVIVQRGSAFAQRINNIEAETGNKIDIIEVPEQTEQLIRFVASGEIDYTISDEHTAIVNQAAFNQLDVNTIVSFPQNVAWALRKNSKQLLQNLNEWMSTIKGNSHLAILYRKYYQNQWAAQMVNSDYFVLNSGRISPYDDEIKKYSEELNWDWRLLASLIYEESNFNPSSRSYAGAFGLMQITSATAQRFGADTTLSPSQNMKIGVMLLKWLDKKLSQYISDKDERVKYVLAAYNVGIGHVIDAMLLTQKYGKDMTQWNDVRIFLLNKSLPKYYNDPIVKFGYCSGIQTTNYVNDVLVTFQHYKNISGHR